LTLKSFENDFGYTKKEATRNSSLSVGLQQLGAFLACFAIWPFTHRFGRKWALVLCSTIFVVGAIIQTINTRSSSAFLAARFIAGIGLGGSSVVVPMFSSEMAPKELRGQIGSFYQLFYTLGKHILYIIQPYLTAIHAYSPPTGSTTVSARIYPQAKQNNGKSP
jgi:MFS family permease